MRHLTRLPAAATLAVGALALASLSPVARATAVPAGTLRVAVAGTIRVAIAGTRPSWAVTAHQVGRPLTAGSVRAQVYLAGRDQAGLTAYAAAVSTPGSSLYRRYLTPAQANARFGATRKQISALTSWLTAAGMRVTRVQDNGPAGDYIAARGSLTAASKAFEVSFARYRGPGGHIYRAPSQAASVPGPLAGSVLSITGLDTASHVATPDLAASGRPVTPAPPCSSYFGQKIATKKPAAYGRHQPWRICGYTPRQLRGAYGVLDSGMTGRGQAVAIVDPYDSPTIRSDASRYARRTGDPKFRSGQYLTYQIGRFTPSAARSCGAPSTWYGAQTLDVESLHGLAPGASIRYVAAANCNQWNLLNALAFIVNRHLASIVSDSWGWPAQDLLLQQTANSIFKLGAAEGIGFFFASGDTGYGSPAKDSPSRVQVQFPTSSPWVTSVGGTSLAVGEHNTYQFETSWGTLYDPQASNDKNWRSPPPGSMRIKFSGKSGGGGVSTVYPQPSYQRGVVPASLAREMPNGSVARAPMRVIPDVAADANPFTGMLVGQTTRHGPGAHAFGLTVVGGTSLATPVFAAIEADAQQAAGYPLGFANPAIYARYGTSAFHDVTDHPRGPGFTSQVAKVHATPARIEFILAALGTDGQGATALQAVKGYDDATGVGSPAAYIQSFPAVPSLTRGQVMTALAWETLLMAVLFVLAIAGIPLWLTVKRPDIQPDFSQAHAYLAAKAAGNRPAATPVAAPVAD